MPVSNDKTKARTSRLPSATGSAARTPAMAWPVGAFIEQEAQERGWSVEELVRRMGGDDITQLTVELLIHAPTQGATLDDKTAEQLSRAFGTSKELWLNLDKFWQQNGKVRGGV